jgi:prepilin-type N-terminal cleavage/methylation domain-containing protein
MKKLPCVKAFTLIEILLVIAIISTVTAGLYISFRGSRSNQALVMTSESLADVFRSAHISSRQSKDSLAWGVKSESANFYALYSRSPTVDTRVKIYSTDSSVTILTDFEVWFNQGSGETDTPLTVELKNIFGRKTAVEVLNSGTVNVTQL